MITKQDLEKLYQTIEGAEESIEKIKLYVQKLQADIKKEEYRRIPGIEGVFDGQYLVPSEGEKIEVPANYAAKSRLVYGDILKLIEEDGKKLFKQVEKVERKKVTGIATKKEGKWYVLCDSGSYRISDVAAEFNGVKLNDEVVVIIPSNNLNAPYAALDKPENQPGGVLNGEIKPKESKAKGRVEEKKVKEKESGGGRKSEGDKFDKIKPSKKKKPKNKSQEQNQDKKTSLEQNPQQVREKMEYIDQLSTEKEEVEKTLEQKKPIFSEDDLV